MLVAYEKTNFVSYCNDVKVFHKSVRVGTRFIFDAGRIFRCKWNCVILSHSHKKCKMNPKFALPCYKINFKCFMCGSDILNKGQTLLRRIFL